MLIIQQRRESHSRATFDNREGGRGWHWGKKNNRTIVVVWEPLDFRDERKLLFARSRFLEILRRYQTKKCLPDVRTAEGTQLTRGQETTMTCFFGAHNRMKRAIAEQLFYTCLKKRDPGGCGDGVRVIHPRTVMAAVASESAIVEGAAATAAVAVSAVWDFDPTLRPQQLSSIDTCVTRNISKNVITCVTFYIWMAGVRGSKKKRKTLSFRNVRLDKEWRWILCIL